MQNHEHSNTTNSEQYRVTLTHDKTNWCIVWSLKENTYL